jgi:peptidyl-prolyl cis-trans isomerase SurA
MEPAMRAYLTTLREQAYIDIKPGYVDTGASAKQTKPIFSAYVAPTAKKKKKMERTRFRENTHGFRQKAKPEASAEAPVEQTPAAAKPGKKSRKGEKAEQASMKPGKKEKIRLGRAPTKTLPSAPQNKTEDAGGGVAPETASSGQEPVNPLEPARPTQKTRFSERAKQPRQDKRSKAKGPKPDALAPAAPDSAEVADRQTQAGPLGLAGDTSKKKKKASTTTGDKTRLSDKKKNETPAQGTGDVPLGQAPQTPAPAPQPKQ